MSRISKHCGRDDRFWWAILLLFALPATTREVDARHLGASEVTHGTYRIESEQVHYDLTTGDFSMTKPVRFAQPGTDVTGDRATGNVRRKTVVITGHVVLHDDGRFETASHLHRGLASTLTTDELVIEDSMQRFTAIGHVRYRQGDRTALAQRGVLDRSLNTLQLSGDVALADASTTIRAQDVLYDLVTTQVRASGDPVTVHRVSSQ